MGDPFTFMVVLITDAEGGGFCSLPDGYWAHQYAQAARIHCIHINAIQVGSLDLAANKEMLDYKHTTCGWFEIVPYDGTGIADAVDKMFHVQPYCNCQ
jgi:hypothetical protein